MNTSLPAHALGQRLDFNHETEAEARSPPGQWRLLAVALICWALTAWAILSPGRGGIIALCAGVAGSLMLLAWRFTNRNAARVTMMLALLCGLLVLTGCRVHILEGQRSAASFQHAAQIGKHVTFTAQLVGFPERKRTAFGDREWVRVQAYAPTQPQPAGGTVPMLVWLSDIDSNWQDARWGPGTRVHITAKLKAQPSSDAAAYTANPLSVHEIGGAQQVVGVQSTDRIDTPTFTASVGAAAATFRTLLVQHASAVTGAELVPGFAVGDTSLVPESLNDTMLESSLSHLTAVSGSNVGLVIAAMGWCVTRLGAGRRVRALVGGGALISFVAVVGPDASVLRAAAMAAVLLVGAFGGRRASALPALGLAVLALIVADPWQSLQAGFALSVAATLGILLLVKPFNKWLRVRLRMPAALSLPLAVALAAQLACGPLLLLLQPGIPAVGVIANVVAAPAAPLGTGLGLIAAILGPISTELATLFVHAASVPAGWVAATAEVCAHLPAGRWHWPDGWPGALLLTACQLAFITAFGLSSGNLGLPRDVRKQLRNPWQAVEVTPLSVRVVAALLTSAAITTFVAVTLLYPLATRLSTPQNWLVVACDVGQGDALLARDPSQPTSVMLIDTGDDPDALQSCFDLFGVQRITLLVLTHDDRDHVGALASVLSQVDTAIIAPTIAGERTDDRSIVQLLHGAGVPFRVGSAGDAGTIVSSIGTTPLSLNWRVLAPEAHAVPSETNEASLVLLLEISGHRALFLADTGYEEQRRLLQRSGSADSLTDIEILKVAHHGSRDQDMSIFERISATWGLISVGADNRYGHPTSDTLGALLRAGTQPLRTDEYGSIAIVRLSDGSLGTWVDRGQ